MIRMAIGTRIFRTSSFHRSISDRRNWISSSRFPGSTLAVFGASMIQRYNVFFRSEISVPWIGYSDPERDYFDKKMPSFSELCPFVQNKLPRPSGGAASFDMKIEDQISCRRTFAIISHPDAGKTTLTEKLLLFGGAIQTAGAVKSNKIKKSATSDFMEIERQRGISV